MTRARARIDIHLRNLAAATATSTALAACGFLAVDPMPPPSKCEGAAGLFKATASWKVTGGTRLLEIILTHPDGHAELKVVGQPDAPAGSNIMDVKTDGQTTTILVDPNPAYASRSASVKITCPAGPAQLGIEVTDGDAGDGALSVRVYDVRSGY
jgi:hypothetical protein